MRAATEPIESRRVMAEYLLSPGFRIYIDSQDRLEPAGKATAGRTFRRPCSNPLVAADPGKFAEIIRGASVLRDVVDDEDLVQDGPKDLHEVLMRGVREVGVSRLDVGEADEEAV